MKRLSKAMCNPLKLKPIQVGMTKEARELTDAAAKSVLDAMIALDQACFSLDLVSDPGMDPLWKRFSADLHRENEYLRKLHDLIRKTELHI